MKKVSETSEALFSKSENAPVAKVENEKRYTADRSSVERIHKMFAQNLVSREVMTDEYLDTKSYDGMQQDFYVRRRTSVD